MINPLEQEISLFGLIKFTLPTILMMMFMSFYTMVDGIFVSNFVSTSALSAVNIVFPLLSIVIGISIMLATGGSAIIAKKMGEDKHLEAKKTLSMLVYLGVIIGFIIVFIGITFLSPILRFLGANNEIFKLSYDYAFIMIWFFPLAILQMLFEFSL